MYLSSSVRRRLLETDLEKAGSAPNHSQANGHPIRTVSYIQVSPLVECYNYLNSQLNQPHTLDIANFCDEIVVPATDRVDEEIERKRSTDLAASTTDIMIQCQLGR